MLIGVCIRRRLFRHWSEINLFRLGILKWEMGAQDTDVNSENTREIVKLMSLETGSEFCANSLINCFEIIF